MTCREVIDFLMEYLSGEAPDDQRATFEQHLAECAACRAYLATYQETVRHAQAAYAPSDETAGEQVPDELVKAILATKRRN